MSEPSSPAAPPAETSRAEGGRPGPGPVGGPVEASLVPVGGWHFLHLFYRVDRARFLALSDLDRQVGRDAVLRAIDPKAPEAPDQIQGFALVGHKADFGLVLAGPDLWKLHDVQRAIESSPIGPALERTYSFYSVTEVSEYVPDVEAYGKILRDREGMDPESSHYGTKVKQYAARLGAMNKQRMYPEFPDWPVFCFYPMSKSRLDGQNWYMLPFEERNAMMADHGKSGMKFAGKVSQVITASTGLDDWEWGVTLWAKNPSYLKDIVYTMRFDRASAQYAEFGPFYPGFILPPAELLAAVRI